MHKVFIKNKLVIILLGNTLDFFDLGLYGALAPLISSLFFPPENVSHLAIYSTCIYISSFIARPLGGVIFGYIGDKFNPTKAFSLSMLFMGISTCVIPFIPTYAQIGLLSPFLLLLSRTIQGACTGGEYNGSAILLMEKLDENLWGKVSGLVCFSGLIGFFLASIISLIILKFKSITWLWHVPFFMGAFIALISYYLRCTLYNYNKKIIKKQREYSFAFFIKNYKYSFLRTCGVGFFAGSYTLTIIGFFNIYFPYIQKINTYSATLLNVYSILILAFLTLISGWFSHLLDYKKFMKFSAIGSFLLAYPCVAMLHLDNLLYIICALTILASLTAGFMGPMHKYMQSLFPQGIRYRAISVGFSLGLSLFGVTSSILFSILLNITSFIPIIAIYLTLCSVVGIFSVEKVSLRRYMGYRYK